MINWVMARVKSPSYSICINGDIHGYFKGKRGLRQGDPLSPYLFTLVMEVLPLILQRRVRLSGSFRFHKHCEELRIINVCFADDLFIFARGDVESAKVIMDSLNEFKLVSGLVPSIPKSTVLLQRRLQLCNSVISSMQVYWASVLSIPFGIIDDIQQLIRGFLWCNGEYKRGKSKVSWDVICLPKSEGGLGIRCLKVFNGALMATHIWNIVTNKDSLWVRWIHMYKLKDRTFWDVRPKASMSWGWRKLLQLREVMFLIK
ncbi:putative reverse transcriptase domain, reverse transcriptase zinc-binding domain protein [Tanacetum coccineum]